MTIQHQGRQGLVQAVHRIQRRPQPRQAAPVRRSEAQATLTIRAGGEASVLLTGKCLENPGFRWFNMDNNGVI